MTGFRFFVFLSALFFSLHCVDLENYMMKPNAPNRSEIPKIIHQVWVGKKSIPKICKRVSPSWLKKHPGWKYKLWTDKDIHTFPWIDKKSFLQANNPGMKSDIWRYQILSRYGGLYVDMDFECIKSFESIHNKSSFYTGFLTPEKSIGLANALIGAKKNHPILTELIEKIRIKRKTMPHKPRPGHQLSYLTSILEYSGPTFFNKTIAKYLKEHPEAQGVHIFPSSYFYPIGPKFFLYCKRPTRYQLDSRITNDAHAIHYFARSWQ